MAFITSPVLLWGGPHSCHLLRLFNLRGVDSSPSHQRTSKHGMGGLWLFLHITDGKQPQHFRNVVDEYGEQEPYLRPMLVFVYSHQVLTTVRMEALCQNRP